MEEKKIIVGKEGDFNLSRELLQDFREMEKTSASNVWLAQELGVVLDERVHPFIEEKRLLGIQKMIEQVTGDPEKLKLVGDRLIVEDNKLRAEILGVELDSALDIYEERRRLILIEEERLSNPRSTIFKLGDAGYVLGFRVETMGGSDVP